MPMIAFTIIILGFVFVNIIGNFGCSSDYLCSRNGLMNTTSKSYYVDFPATSLGFISSLSSTVSFTLVGVLMPMFAYTIAAQLIQTSDNQDEKEALLSPYQTSLMMRVLNAEILSLWELSSQPAGRRALRSSKHAEGLDTRAKKPTMLRKSALVFFLCIFASLLIQAADSYLHLTTDAVNMVHVFQEPSELHQLGRRIGPWCFNTKETFGTQANINFWSCALAYNETAQALAPANMTIWHRTIGDPLDDYVLNYTEADGSQYAIIGPSTPPQDVDWDATSFAVSSHCMVLPATACNIKDGTSVFEYYCQESRGSPVDIGGYVSDGLLSLNFLKFHKYLEEQPPFITPALEGWDNVPKFAPNVTDENSSEMWQNPWHWMAEVSLLVEEKDLPEDIAGAAWLLNGLGYKMVVQCSSTVYNVTYTAVEGQVTSMSKTASNTTTAGITIMPMLETLGFARPLHDSVMRQASRSRSLKSWLTMYELGISKAFTVPLAVHTIPEKGAKAQKRISKVITKLPAASLWLLVLANMSFAILGIVLAILAFGAASDDVHQLQTRLNISGLAAALFEEDAGKRAVKSESELFEENHHAGEARVEVGVRRTAPEVMAWMLHERRAD